MCTFSLIDFFCVYFIDVNPFRGYDIYPDTERVRPTGLTQSSWRRFPRAMARFTVKMNALCRAAQVLYSYVQRHNCCSPRPPREFCVFQQIAFARLSALSGFSSTYKNRFHWPGGRNTSCGKNISFSAHESGCIQTSHFSLPLPVFCEKTEGSGFHLHSWTLRFLFWTTQVLSELHRQSSFKSCFSLPAAFSSQTKFRSSG